MGLTLVAIYKMGQYINRDSKGNTLPASYQGKLDTLMADGAVRIDPMTYEDGLICVVNNGMFGAAGYMYSESEYNYWKSPEASGGRPMTWLIHPTAKDLVD